MYIADLNLSTTVSVSNASESNCTFHTGRDVTPTETQRSYLPPSTLNNVSETSIISQPPIPTYQQINHEQQLGSHTLNRLHKLSC